MHWRWSLKLFSLWMSRFKETSKLIHSLSHCQTHSCQLVCCENGSSVRLTMIDGRSFLWLRSKMMKEQLRRIPSAANDRRAGLRAAAAEAEEWHPAYRQMYLKAAAQDLGINRWRRRRERNSNGLWTLF